MKRPEQPILAISPLVATCRQLAMSWGVYPEYCPEGNLNVDNFRDMLWVACEIANRKGLVSDDKDLLVVTAGFPFGTPGAANIIRVIPGKALAFAFCCLVFAAWHGGYLKVRFIYCCSDSQPLDQRIGMPLSKDFRARNEKARLISNKYLLYSTITRGQTKTNPTNKVFQIS